MKDESDEAFGFILHPSSFILALSPSRLAISEYAYLCFGVARLSLLLEGFDEMRAIK
jgi:hypothetical protein